MDAKAHEQEKPERVYRYINRLVVSEKRLLLTSQGMVRYGVKGFTNAACAGAATFNAPPQVLQISMSILITHLRRYPTPYQLCAKRYPSIK